MFEPQKLITVALALILLAPFGFVFWRIAAYHPRPDAQVRADLEAALREQGREQIATNADGGVTISSVVAVRRIEAIGFFHSTMSWLSFFPRPWIGVLGLVAVACVLVCLVISLFFAGGTEMTVRDLPTAGPATGVQK
jgi:hypothetical protein